jgi:exodeoxyribonuclease VII small subunit
VAKTSAKTGKTTAAKTGGGMKNFEERLGRLESLGEQIRRSDIPLDEALAAFEEGIRLARTLESDLEKIESRIEILMNSAEAPPDEAPELELFDSGE